MINSFVALGYGPDGGPMTMVSTNSPLPVIANAGTGTFCVAGCSAEGAVLSGNVLRVGGSDGTNIHTFNVDTSGRLIVIGPVADGSTLAGWPLRVGGSDGANIRTLLTDAGGRLNVMGTAADGATIVGNPLLIGAAIGSGNMGTLRTPAIFKTAQATASGDNALWTPTAGKKFRLMRFKLQVTANAYIAARGVLTIKLRDGTTDMNLTHDVYLGQTALAADTNPQQLPMLETGWIDLGNGFLSAAANNVLNINLSAALSAGNVRVTCCGTEE
jgi:hypothetical protein